MTTLVENPYRILLEIVKQSRESQLELQKAQKKIYDWNSTYCTFRTTDTLIKPPTLPLAIDNDVNDKVFLIKHAFIEKEKIFVTAILVYNQNDKISITRAKHNANTAMQEQKYQINIDSPKITVIENSNFKSLNDAVQKLDAKTYGIQLAENEMVYISYFGDAVGPGTPPEQEILPNYDLFGIVNNAVIDKSRELYVHVFLRGGLPVPNDTIIILPFWTHDRITVLSRKLELGKLKKTKHMGQLKDALLRLDSFFFSTLFTSIQDPPVRKNNVQLSIKDAKNIDFTTVQNPETGAQSTFIKLTDSAFLLLEKTLQITPGDERIDGSEARELSLTVSQKPYIYGYGELPSRIELEKHMEQLNKVKNGNLVKIRNHLIARYGYLKNTILEPVVEPPVDSLKQAKKQILVLKTQLQAEEKSRVQQDEIIAKQKTGIAELTNKVGDFQKERKKNLEQIDTLKKTAKENLKEIQRLKKANKELQQENKELKTKTPSPPTTQPGPQPRPPLPSMDKFRIAELDAKIEEQKEKLRIRNRQLASLKQNRRDPKIPSEAENRIQEEISLIFAQIAIINDKLSKARHITLSPLPDSDIASHFAFQRILPEDELIVPFDKTNLFQENLTLKNQEMNNLGASLEVSFYTKEASLPIATVSSDAIIPLTMFENDIYIQSYMLRFELITNGILTMKAGTYENSDRKKILAMNLAALTSLPEIGNVIVKFNGRTTYGTYAFTSKEATFPLYFGIPLFNNTKKETVNLLLKTNEKRQMKQKGLVLLKIDQRPDVKIPLLAFINVITYLTDE